MVCGVYMCLVSTYPSLEGQGVGTELEDAFEGHDKRDGEAVFHWHTVEQSRKSGQNKLDDERSYHDVYNAIECIPIKQSPNVYLT